VCTLDFEAEAACEKSCSAQCDPGTVETRCDPAQLSVQCQGACAAQSFCEGTVTTETTCEGSCEAECTGHCSGTCVDEQGHKTDDDPNCHGKCTTHCSGKCNGRCKIDQTTGVTCGAGVSCKGGCTTSYTSPKCESEFTPPKCTVDASCLSQCHAQAVANATCTPPTVKLLADTTVSADVGKLVATIDKNLPPLIDTAESQAHIAVDVAEELKTSGQAIASSSGNLSGQSLACSGAAVQSLGSASATLSVSTQAGASVTQDCTSHAQ
jgi:hypothetical protein